MSDAPDKPAMRIFHQGWLRHRALKPAEAVDFHLREAIGMHCAERCGNCERRFLWHLEQARLNRVADRKAHEVKV